MKYVIFETGGKQYKVKEEDVLLVEKIIGQEKDKLVFDKILLAKDGDKITIGSPYIKGAKLTAQLARQLKDKKIRIAKYKAKSRYRKVKGHRQSKSQIKVVSISV